MRMALSIVLILSSMKVFLIEKNGKLLGRWFNEKTARQHYKFICDRSNDQEDCVCLYGGGMEILEEFGV